MRHLSFRARDVVVQGIRQVVLQGVALAVASAIAVLFVVAEWFSAHVVVDCSLLR